MSSGKVGSGVELDAKTEAAFRKKGFKVVKKLGQGSFGVVYKGVHLDTSQPVAIKEIELSKLNPAFREKYVPTEMGVMMGCQHENIIRLDDIIRCGQRLYIFMEFAPNGDMAKYVKQNAPISEKQARAWYIQILSALVYAHQHLRVAHRDIKLDNVLLDANFQPKLSDFGCSTECWDSKRHCVRLSETVAGSQPYISPQIARRIISPATASPYNPFMADVWAMGVMLYILLTNPPRFPFSMGNFSKMLEEQLDYPGFIKSRFMPHTPELAKDLVVRYLDPDENTRITLHESQQHQWIKLSKTDSSSSVTKQNSSKKNISRKIKNITKSNL